MVQPFIEAPAYAQHAAGRARKLPEANCCRLDLAFSKEDSTSGSSASAAGAPWSSGDLLERLDVAPRPDDASSKSLFDAVVWMAIRASSSSRDADGSNPTSTIAQAYFQPGARKLLCCRQAISDPVQAVFHVAHGFPRRSRRSQTAQMRFTWRSTMTSSAPHCVNTCFQKSMWVRGPGGTSSAHRREP